MAYFSGSEEGIANIGGRMGGGSKATVGEKVNLWRSSHLFVGLAIMLLLFYSRDRWTCHHPQPHNDM